jgi:phosphatidylserine/phosphatidylglycerophosphate/cardiolipin synthase-like enzyme
VITTALLDAQARGVRVRIVTDNEHGVEDDDTTLVELQLAGVPIVDDARSGLMHNKFMIMDSSVVWTGSTNYTVNDVYRNNNNMLVLHSPLAVTAYQSEFDEMFLYRRFGVTSTRGNSIAYEQDGIPIEIYFASEDPVMDAILAQIRAAQSNVRFMAFSFTYDALGMALLERQQAGISVQGIFERVGTGTPYSEAGRLICNGLDVRRDLNPFVLHHKVFIIDDSTVITGSFNFSNNAVSQNDENLVIIRDPLLAALYIEEYNRMLANSAVINYIDCATHPDSPTINADALRTLFRNEHVGELQRVVNRIRGALERVQRGNALVCLQTMETPAVFTAHEIIRDDSEFLENIALYNSLQVRVRAIQRQMFDACLTGATLPQETVAAWITELDAVTAAATTLPVE